LPTFGGGLAGGPASLCQHTHSMALKSTIFKADLQISDMDRHYYQQHA
jgi:hypothetical protein